MQEISCEGCQFVDEEVGEENVVCEASLLSAQNSGSGVYHLDDLAPHDLLDDAGGLGGGLPRLPRDKHHLLDFDTVFELVFFFVAHVCGLG